jgi:cytochrome c oxidase subunit 2
MNRILIALTPMTADRSFWMPARGSTGAEGVDRTFYFIFWVSVFFFALIVGLMVFFVIRYRRREGAAPEASASHNLPLELTWAGIPVILVFVMFYMGMKGMVDLATPPAGAYEIKVLAKRWNWLFEYPNGHVDQDLHVPLDVPVQLLMRSEDVIHSFYVPTFRVKQDIVPGRYTKTWFRATKEGEHLLLCAEYCGTAHSDMIARVIVHRSGEYQRWLEGAADLLSQMSPAEAGRRLHKVQGCAQCHSVDGKSGIGPTFKNVYGYERVMAGGARVLADENYLRESMLNPNAQVVAGFDAIMPTAQGRMSEEQILAVIEYIKTLSDRWTPSAPEATSQPATSQVSDKRP